MSGERRDDMLTVKDLASHFQLCPETVRRKAKSFGGFKLPGCRDWRFPSTILTGLALPERSPCLTQEKAAAPDGLL